MAKYDLDSEDIANPKERTNYLPRCPARYKVRLLEYEEFESDTDVGLKAHVEVLRVIGDNSKAWRANDRQWFDPAASKGDRFTLFFGRKGKFADIVRDKAVAHRRFLAAAFDKECSPDLKVNKFIAKLAQLHEDDELLDLEIELFVEFRVDKISPPKEREGGEIVRYVNGSPVCYGVSHAPEWQQREARDADEDEDDEPAPKRKAKTTSKRKPIDEDDDEDEPKRPAKRKPIDEDEDDEPAPKRKAKTASKRKPIDEDDEDD